MAAKRKGSGERKGNELVSGGRKEGGGAGENREREFVGGRSR